MNTETISFASLNLAPELLKALDESGYTTPTPIQAQAIPVVLQGGDLMAGAQTGTGKTAAFTLPLLQQLLPLASSSASPARHPVRALILTPTRELAIQVEESVKTYAKHTPLRSLVVFGGVDIKSQTPTLMKGVEILVATPGRLLDHVEQRTVQLGQVQMLVLDEADRMLDMGFMPDLKRILALLPKKRQNLMFSATFSNEIKKLSEEFLTKPTLIEVARSNATSENVTQKILLVSAADKQNALADLLRKQATQAIIFTKTKLTAGRLARHLEREGIAAGAIHGDKSQLERIQALDAFKQNKITALVATDVAARGLDIDQLPMVINYELPSAAEDYVHRIGRTGRAGALGIAISLVAPEEEKFLKEIEKLIKRELPKEAAEAPSRPSREYGTRRQEAAAAPAAPRLPRQTSRKKEDEWFFKPYEPSTEAPDPKPMRSRDTPKKEIAALLGGLVRKQ
ncbi:DEAD/DEAH box helicase [Methylobacillus arboreus]|uniref:DEAD/DEAH box helicase n=1 Tax=Methylobacillus arboreus TaxID=755170 RepID=UPI001E33F676|nr:DEAD/DEAH box helicase [Methylobacillus arboreus]MCB5189996.1 DEAD/DEAH box helicase [Methylobacillus arboreus]